MAPLTATEQKTTGRTPSLRRGKVSSWGNSQGVRIPKSVLAEARISVGDSIEIVVTDEGFIQISKAHRHVPADRSVTLSSLVGEGPEAVPVDDGKAWPTDDLVGAEREAWQQ